MDFYFHPTVARRLEARAAVANGQGMSALFSSGAVQEGILRRSLMRDRQYVDQVLWSVVEDERRQASAIWGPKVH